MTINNNYSESTEYQKILKNLVITESNPGSVVKDFETLLTYIKDGVEVSGINNLLNMRLLPQINAGLSKSIDICLKRPQQKSYPHINGLYLLLRATALGLITAKVKNKTISLNEEYLEKWNNLNNTEKYFTLLQAWWCRGTGEVLGEYVSGCLDFRYRCIEFFTKISRKGLLINQDTRKLENLKYYPGIYNLALMELFGMLSIEHVSPNERNKGWNIEHINTTEIGDALIGSFIEVLTSLDYEAYWYSTEISRFREFNEWFASIKDCFSEFKQLLTFPEHKFQNGIHTFKISLSNCWRRIAVSGNVEMDKFASIILDAFGFNQDHLYCFKYQSRFGITTLINTPELLPELLSENITADNICIGELPLYPGLEVLFEYDLIDRWQFRIIVEEIDAEEIEAYYYHIIQKHGKAPQQYGGKINL
ncbi:MAG: hypothetical protein HQK74_09060 [Desulfamplus sp.]|nr:hypothetical protein [Desulfamplus sp.]